MKECKWFFCAGEKIPEPIQANEIRVYVKNGHIWYDTCYAWCDEEIEKKQFRIQDFNLIFKNLEPCLSTLKTGEVNNQNYILKICSMIENCCKDINLNYNDYEVTYFFYED